MAGSRTAVAAFHEGFSDIVAIFQHFSFPSVLRAAIRKSRGKLSESNELVDLAVQFGHATARGEALRTAIDTPDTSCYERAWEPHVRGSILVAAIFDGFFQIYQRRVQDLLRLATGGTGTLPEGEVSPDLVDRLSSEAAAAAQTVLTMCIRAFEYLPPVDITFGDYLRALVTADYDLQAEQGAVERSFMIEAFRRRGIYAMDVRSLAEDALRWPPVPERTVKSMPAAHVARQVLTEANRLDRHTRGRRDLGAAAVALKAWAEANPELLRLVPDGRAAAGARSRPGTRPLRVAAPALAPALRGGGVEAARRGHLGSPRQAPRLRALQGHGLGGDGPGGANRRAFRHARRRRSLAPDARRDPLRSLRPGLRRRPQHVHAVLRLTAARRLVAAHPGRRLPAARRPARDRHRRGRPARALRRRLRAALSDG